ncbi:hypothetical protein [Alkaliphilus sp. B6464]|uniref:hypothetical protein n=1 Tax=Alkaliphilus sp. B6464 TaxID=2731219 RepID=UPI001BA5058E|nr:hypothetical protein [Alkaliphilus sp. B6464]QUH19237.1 hypothetical protein HYG84_04565 [Alkaliphilus sp. B6464]
MKKISIVSLLLVVSMLFVGCTSDELKLYQAFEKSKDITSMESKTDISFTVDVDNLSEEDQEMAKQIVNMINGLKVNAHQKAILNKDKTATKAEAKVGVNFGGMQMDMQVWIDADMSGETPKMIEIIKMPQLMMASLSPESESKEYIVYDIGKMMNAGQEEVDFSKFAKLGKDIEAKLTDFVKEHYLDFDPGFKMINSKGKKTVDGESLSIYEVKLDDAAFKKLIRYSVNDLLDNKDAVEFIKDYMNSVMDIVEIEESEKLSAKEEFNQGLNKFEEEVPELKKKFNEFMDKFDKVKVLGDNGITIEYGINKDGYITHEEGVIDLNIDLGSIEKTFINTDIAGKSMLGEKAPIIKLGIKFKTNIYNINNKDINITMPDVNAENALYFNDLIPVIE